jgi:hypothetical protein
MIAFIPIRNSSASDPLRWCDVRPSSLARGALSFGTYGSCYVLPLPPDECPNESDVHVHAQFALYMVYILRRTPREALRLSDEIRSCPLGGWANKQVDCTNYFAEAEMKETVFIEPPKLCGPKSGQDLVLLLLKLMYGLKQAPQTFYEKLRDGLLER